MIIIVLVRGAVAHIGLRSQHIRILRGTFCSISTENEHYKNVKRGHQEYRKCVKAVRRPRLSRSPCWELLQTPQKSQPRYRPFGSWASAHWALNIRGFKGAITQLSCHKSFFSNALLKWKLQVRHKMNIVDAANISEVFLLHSWWYIVLLFKILRSNSCSSKTETRMWADAQRDGRPAEYRWRSLFNAAKFD